MFARDEREKGNDGLEEAKSILRGIGRRLRCHATYEVRQEIGERSDTRARGVVRPRRDRSERTQRFDPRPILRRYARLPCTCPSDLRPPRRGLPGEVFREACLADARLAHEEEERSLALLRGRVQTCAELAELAIAYQERLWPICRHACILIVSRRGVSARASHRCARRQSTWAGRSR